MSDNFTEAMILSPKLPEKLDKIELSNIYLQNDDFFKFKLINHCRIENQNAEHLTFEQVIFDNVTFIDASFKSIDLVDVTFKNCNLSNTDLGGAIIHRVAFIDCNLMGINFLDATFRNVVFQNCNARYSCFRYLNLERVVFKKCILNNSDFQQAKLLKMCFHHCELVQAQMSGVSLKGIDLRDNNIEGIGISLEGLNGAIVSPQQAVDLSKKIGLVVK